jgi:hypothetical protein
MPSLKKAFKFSLYFTALSTSALIAGPVVVPMNKAFSALTELLPFLTTESKFYEKTNEKHIKEQLKVMGEAFKVARHDSLLKQDIFAPSLESIKNELKIVEQNFSQGNKSYSLWRLKSVSSQCMSCHTRLPENVSSSFQDGSRLVNPTKFDSPYDLGVARLIVRQYPLAKESFTLALDESFVKKDFKDFLKPLKQILLIQTKVFKDPTQMNSILAHYLSKKGISLSDREVLKAWQKRLDVWSKGSLSKWRRLSTDDESKKFMSEVLAPLFDKNNLYIGKHDVDLLMAQGLLANFLFENPNSEVAADATYWIGITEKFLERESFVGTGEQFFKECIIRYPKSQAARNCLDEYKESIEFNFSGSRGTDIPSDIQDELKRLEKLLKN